MTNIESPAKGLEKLLKYMFIIIVIIFITIYTYLEYFICFYNVRKEQIINS